MTEARRKLTIKQRRFLEEYVIDKNAVQAYFRAYGRKYKGKPRSYKAAQVTASKILSNAFIQEELKQIEDVYTKQIRLSKARVLQEIKACALYDPDDLYEADPANGGLPMPRPWNEIPPMARKAIQSVKIKRKRLRAGKRGDATEWEIEELEYKMVPKTSELDKLCKKLGFYRDAEDQSKPTGDVVNIIIEPRDDTPDAP